MTAWLLVLQALLGVLMVRNVLVYRVRMRRIEEINGACKRDIGCANFHKLLTERYAELDHVGYLAMVFDVSCWTFRQFYPQDVA